ncbi:MAG: Carbamoyl-phosphate synthase large chain [Alphaproteobacteria bacterium ADurb.Bin438]|nr:MAG: Carbamoyl-phosphate synthase large chain [Alphaproteobacteria bacterium ADurb.Bin438]
MILGGGPNRIGQGIEFDYCCVHASFALKKIGYESIMVNSNPETVSTDYDTSDKLYFEPLTVEDIMHIYEREKCDGVIVQFGGQTPLNLAKRLEKAGAHIIGTSTKSIDMAEDRDFFKGLVEKLGINQPDSGIAYSVEDAVKIANKISYPVLVRPSFVLGGRGMMIVYNEKDLRQYVKQATDESEGKAILIDKFLENAIELDVDCVSDGKTTVVGAIMEHVEPAGIHSGDSASIIPPMSLSNEIIELVRKHTHDLAKSLKVCGLMNVQYAIKNGKVYIIEVNPRASRTVPFVSKTIGAPLAQIATACMCGKTLEELDFTKEIKVPYTAVKEAVFPFAKFGGVGAILSPEMKSTGEVMGIDYSRGLAYLKSQIAGGNEIPMKGNVFVSIKGMEKLRAVEYIKELAEVGFKIYATKGTSTALYNAGVKSEAIFHIGEARPNVLDLLKDARIDWVIKVSDITEQSMNDEMKIRAITSIKNIPITTTIEGISSAIIGIKEKLDFGRLEVCSIQEYQRHKA